MPLLELLQHVHCQTTRTHDNTRPLNLDVKSTQFKSVNHTSDVGGKIQLLQWLGEKAWQIIPKWLISWWILSHLTANCKLCPQVLIPRQIKKPCLNKFKFSQFMALSALKFFALLSLTSPTEAYELGSVRILPQSPPNPKESPNIFDDRPNWLQLEPWEAVSKSLWRSKWFVLLFGQRLCIVIG